MCYNMLKIIRVASNTRGRIVNMKDKREDISLTDNNTNTAGPCREDLFALAVSFFLSIIYLFQSPLHPWIRGLPGKDSNVFRTVAFMMSKGYFPYKDTFDHKGPFLYILEYLGQMISGDSGIWMIELISLTVSAFFMYKTARLVCGKTSSVIASLLACRLLFDYLHDGNMSEEYAMPFIALALFIFLDYLINDKINVLRLILSGAGLGTVLMLRPNMISTWIVFCIYIAVRLFRAKEYKKLLVRTGWFLCGVLIVTAPMIIWIIANGAFSCFWDSYIVFNLHYSSVEGGTLISDQWATSLSFANTSIFIISFSILFYQLKETKKKWNIIIYLIYLSLTVLLIGLSGMQYGHYGVILIPALVYPLSLLFSDIEAIKQKDIRKVFLMIVSLFALSIFIVPSWLDVIARIPSIIESKDISKIEQDAELNAILDIIEEHTTEDQPISVYGNQDFIYLLSNRKHATRYSYISPIGYIQPEFMDEYFSQLSEELPNVLIVEKGFFEDRINAFIAGNNYVKEYATAADYDPRLEVYTR